MRQLPPQKQKPHRSVLLKSSPRVSSLKGTHKSVFQISKLALWSWRSKNNPNAWNPSWSLPQNSWPIAAAKGRPLNKGTHRRAHELPTLTDNAEKQDDDTDMERALQLEVQLMEMERLAKVTEKTQQQTGDANFAVKAASSRPLLMPPPPPPRGPIQQKPALKLQPKQQHSPLKLEPNQQLNHKNQHKLTTHTTHATTQPKFHKSSSQVRSPIQKDKYTQLQKSTAQTWNSSNVERPQYRLPLKPTIQARTSPAGVDPNIKSEVRDSFRCWNQLTAAARNAGTSSLTETRAQPLHGSSTDASDMDSSEIPISQHDKADAAHKSDASTSGQAPDTKDEGCTQQKIKEEYCSESESEEFEADYGTDEDHAALPSPR